MRVDFQFFLKNVKKAPYKGARWVYSLFSWGVSVSETASLFSFSAPSLYASCFNYNSAASTFCQYFHRNKETPVEKTGVFFFLRPLGRLYDCELTAITVVNWFRRELHYNVMRCGIIYIFFHNELLFTKAIQFTRR